MPTISCPQKIDCACSDFPIANFSSEDADSPVFIAVYNPPYDPPLGANFSAQGCLRIAESTISQEDADLEAQRQAQECLWSFSYGNDAQECNRPCADGNAFIGRVSANEIRSLWPGAADALAQSLACQRARLRQICFLSATDLTPACRNEPYSLQVQATGGTPWSVTFTNIAPLNIILPIDCASEISVGDVFSYTWEIVSGSLPAGLELACTTGIISGTPTGVGNSTFTLRITDSVGSFQQKEFTLRTIEITSASPLPDGAIGNAYSQTLAAAGTTGALSWQIVDGTLPPGLTLNEATGEISGTPTGPSATNLIRVRLQDNAS